MYKIEIEGVDRTSDVINESVITQDSIDNKITSCKFTLIDKGGGGMPLNGDEVIITVDSSVVFGGLINTSTLKKMPNGVVETRFNCLDYSVLLDGNLVRKNYQSMTDKAIIEDIVATYAAGKGITTNNVVLGVTIDQISFNYIQPSQALRRIAELTGRHWFIDTDKDIHYFPANQEASPFNINSANNEYKNLEIDKDNTMLKNRVYVRGGTKISDFTTYREKGDGEKTVFNLPDKPRETSIKVNDVAKTVGVKHIDTSGFDWYVNFQEKYIEQDGGGSVLTSSDTLEVTFKYDIPILVAVEDTDSIEEHGEKEFAIFDRQIRTTEAARDRARAELTDYANTLIEGSFDTYTHGFRSGQFVNINLSDYGVNDDYIIQRVISESMGAGNFLYHIELASAKTIGIIRFLINLLESNRNLLELSDNEVVDELFQLTDSLLSDSLLDSLTIDSLPPHRTWADEDDTSITRARWNLFSWK